MGPVVPVGGVQWGGSVVYACPGRTLLLAAGGWAYGGTVYYTCQRAMIHLAEGDVRWGGSVAWTRHPSYRAIGGYRWGGSVAVGCEGLATHVPEGDYRFGGSTAWAVSSGSLVDATPAGGTRAGGSVDATFTPGPCSGPGSVCCGGSEIPPDPLWMYPLLAGGDCPWPDATRWPLAISACPSIYGDGAVCWCGTPGGPWAAIGRICVVCRADGSWVWGRSGGLCGEGDFAAELFASASCPPVLLMTSGQTCTDGVDSCVAFWSLRIQDT